MVNLRFHIVSIAAVFLALAVGIVMGSTLLDRATVDSLKARQSSLEDKIDERVTENNAFRQEIGLLDERDQEFEVEPMPPLTDGLVEDDVLVLAVRGVDEGQVAAIGSDLAAAGATPRGVVWVDQAVDVADDGRRRAVADALGAPELADDADAAREALAERLAAALVGARAEPPTGGGVEDGAALAALDDAGLVSWEPPPGSDERTLPPGGVRLIVVSGEGAQPEAGPVVLDLLTAAAARSAGPVVAVEVMDPRSRIGTIERALAGEEPVRGAFTDPIRDDEVLAAEVTTIDNGDRPFGRLALVLVLAEGDEARVGHYGETETAEQAFPTATTG